MRIASALRAEIYKCYEECDGPKSGQIFFFFFFGGGGY